MPAKNVPDDISPCANAQGSFRKHSEQKNYYWVERYACPQLH